MRITEQQPTFEYENVGRYSSTFCDCFLPTVIRKRLNSHSKKAGGCPALLGGRVARGNSKRYSRAAAELRCDRASDDLRCDSRAAVDLARGASGS